MENYRSTNDRKWFLCIPEDCYIRKVIYFYKKILEIVKVILRDRLKIIDGFSFNLQFWTLIELNCKDLVESWTMVTEHKKWTFNQLPLVYTCN